MWNQNRECFYLVAKRLLDYHSRPQLALKVVHSSCSLCHVTGSASFAKLPIRRQSSLSKLLFIEEYFKSCLRENGSEDREY